MSTNFTRAATSGDPHPSSRRIWARRLGRALALLGLLVALQQTGFPASAAVAARFVPQASSATWDGTVVTVAFVEVGAPPDATTHVAIEAAGTVESVCRMGGQVVATIRSSATVREEADHRADAGGTVTATRNLVLVVTEPSIQGLDCTPVARRLRVALRDTTTGAMLVITGTPRARPTS